MENEIMATFPRIIAKRIRAINQTDIGVIITVIVIIVVAWAVGLNENC